MSAAKHTPGPWVFDGHSRVDALQFRTETRYVDEDGKEQVYMQGLVALPYGCGGPETQQANAALIAASPALLEAAQAAWNCIAELPPTQARVEVAQLLQAAIAQATGSTE